MQGDFPRGGPLVKRRRENGPETNDRLFFERVGKGKPKHKKKRLSVESVVDDDYEEGGDPLAFKRRRNVSEIEPITRKSLVEGMLFMGFVRKIRKYDVEIELPNNLSGTVALTDVSDSYMEQLRNYVQSNEDEAAIKGPSSLKDLFSVGTALLCKVKSVAVSTSVDKYDGRIKMKPIALTLNPKDVNQELFRGKPHAGMVLTGAVESIEDHGYVVDLGLKKTKGFVSHDKAKKYFEKSNGVDRFVVGQIVFCSIDTKAKTLNWKEARIIQLTVKPKSINVLRKISKPLSKTTSLHPGSIVMAKISKKFDDGLCIVSSGLKGFVHFNTILDQFRVNREEYAVDQQVVGRVLYKHPTSEIYFVGISSHVYSLSLINESFLGLEENGVVDGAKVLQVSNKGVILGLKDGIIGFAKKSFIPNINLIEVGSEQRCFIIGFNYFYNHVVLSLKGLDFTMNDITVGSFLTGKVNEIMDSKIRVTLSYNVNGLISFIHLADEFTDDVLTEFPVGKNIKCRVLNVYADRNLLILTVKESLMKPELPMLLSYDDVSPGTIAVGWIEKISHAGLFIRFFGDVVGYVLNREISHLDKSCFKCGQTVTCEVLSYNQKSNKLDLKIKDFYKFEPTVIEDTTKGEIKTKTKSLNKLDKTKKMVGEQVSISKEKCLVSINSKITKSKKKLSLISKDVDSDVTNTKMIEKSFLISKDDDSVVTKSKAVTTKEKVSSNEVDSVVGNSQSAKVIKKLSSKQNSTNSVQKSTGKTKKVNDLNELTTKRKLKSDAREVTNGKSTPIDILSEPTRKKIKNESDILNVDMNLSNYCDFDELSKNIKKYLDDVADVESSESEEFESEQQTSRLDKTLQKHVTRKPDDCSTREKAKVDRALQQKNKSVTKQFGSRIERLKVSSGFLWNAEDIDASLQQKQKSDSSSDDEDDEEEQNVVNSRKVKSKKRILKEQLEEKDLFKTEHLLMDPDRKPETADDFDKLILSSPNSSLVWLKYMAFHLESAELDKARTVAERALKTISFREEQEKLNVWVAYLNIENLYGTSLSLKSVFKRALQYNKPIDIYKKMVAIYESTDKIEAAEDLYTTMTKRFKNIEEVWFEYGTFLMKNGKLDSARNILERSLVCLQKKEHVGVIVKFASLEFKYGEQQRGRTMLESVLSSYSKRIDIWFIYTDLVTKSSDLEGARLIFERMITLKLQAKKMKSVFMKYLDFEKKHGTENMVARIVQKAEEYAKTDGLEDIDDV